MNGGTSKHAPREAALMMAAASGDAHLSCSSYTVPAATTPTPKILIAAFDSGWYISWMSILFPIVTLQRFTGYQRAWCLLATCGLWVTAEKTLGMC